MTYTTANEEQAFGYFFLTDLIGYIADNFEPEEVFGEDRIKECVAGSLDVDDVFSTSLLEKWALDNGFVREEVAE